MFLGEPITRRELITLLHEWKQLGDRMPVQKVQSGILAKMGQRLVQAQEAHKNDAPAFGNQQLPAGIEGGVAQLIECHIGEYKEGPNKGSPFFMASGMVKLPRMKDGLSLYGMRTQIGPEPLCDTPQATGQRKTFDDHYGWMLNQVRILAGVEGELNLGTDPQAIEANLMALLNTLTTMKPHFRFRTWQGKKVDIEKRSNPLAVGGFSYFVGTKGPYPSEQAAKAANPYAGQEPRVVHEWNGACAFEDTSDGSEGMEDSTPPAVANAGSPASNGATTPVQGKLAKEPPMPSISVQGATTQRSNSTTPNVTNLPTQVVETPIFDDMGDIDSLIQRATADDAEAQARLKDMAMANGAQEEDVDSAESWEAVAAMCGYGSEATSEGEEEVSEPDNTPIKGGIYKFKPLDPKTRQPGARVVEVEVVEVDTTTQTVTLKSKTNPKAAPYKGVSWDALIV